MHCRRRMAHGIRWKSASSGQRAAGRFLSCFFKGFYPVSMWCPDTRNETIWCESWEAQKLAGQQIFFRGKNIQTISLCWQNRIAMAKTDSSGTRRVQHSTCNGLSGPATGDWYRIARLLFVTCSTNLSETPLGGGGSGTCLRFSGDSIHCSQHAKSQLALRLQEDLHPASSRSWSLGVFPFCRFRFHRLICRASTRRQLEGNKTPVMRSGSAQTPEPFPMGALRLSALDGNWPPIVFRLHIHGQAIE